MTKMLKAEQAAVVHQANVDIVTLRQAEINYFALFFTSFGTQAALIAGFIVNSVSQAPGKATNLFGKACETLSFCSTSM